jgi:ABC-type uncharacterized transport system substrate-binding protein
MHRPDGWLWGEPVRRRDFITLLGGAAAAWPLAASAQQPHGMRRVGVLIGVSRDAEGQARVTAFMEALQALGWIDGRNVQFDERWSSGDAQLMQHQAKELVAGKPDVILVASNPALAALRQETRTVPIVFAQVVDPVGAGFVASAARPGGNITGFSHIEYTVPRQMAGIAQGDRTPPDQGRGSGQPDRLCLAELPADHRRRSAFPRTTGHPCWHS